MEIKISVVIPTYRRPKLLTKCLTALAKQTLDHTDFEVIVVSDGPDQVTLLELMSWMKKADFNLIYLNTAEKRGPASARNLGWLYARGRAIAFTDDDCIPQEDWLATYLKEFESTTASLVAFSGQTQVPILDTPTDFALNTSHLQEAEFITANCACTKYTLIKIGGFDERYKLAWREDSDFQFKLIVNEIDIKKVRAAVVTHPVRPAPWGVSISDQKKGLYDALLYKKYPKLYRSKIQKSPIWNYYLINLLWLTLLLSLLLFDNEYLAIGSGLGLAFLICRFVIIRLKYTSKSVTHILEMIYTSIFIPTLSVYWRLYGAVKFRVFFI